MFRRMVVDRYNVVGWILPAKECVGSMKMQQEQEQEQEWWRMEVLKEGRK